MTVLKIMLKVFSFHIILFKFYVMHVIIQTVTRRYQIYEKQYLFIYFPLINFATKADIMTMIENKENDVEIMIMSIKNFIQII